MVIHDKEKKNKKINYIGQKGLVACSLLKGLESPLQKLNIIEIIC